MTLLLLVRHAVSEGNDRGLLMGWTPGIHLTEEGREQARALAERLAPIPIAAIYSSPLERCRETAAPLARAKALRPRVLRDLGEVRYGDWTGKPLRRLARTRLWQAVQHAPSHVRFPGGESLIETQARALVAIERIATAHPHATVVAVSHADVIRLLLAHHLGVHLDLYQRLAVAPGSVSAVALGEGAPRVLRVNDTGDLRGLAPRSQRRVRG